MSTGTRSWPVPVALIALSAIPVTAGTLRLIQLAGGPAVIPADHRFAGFPLPQVGELVLTEPMPSIPVSFWAEPDSSRLRADYFGDVDPGRA